MRRWVVGLAIVTGALSIPIAPPALPKSTLSLPTRAAVEVASSPLPRRRPLTTASKRLASGRSECVSERKRLWVKGEGWIVRRLTTCSYDFADPAKFTRPQLTSKNRYLRM
jgi:hypothetical protein